MRVYIICSLILFIFLFFFFFFFQAEDGIRDLTVTGVQTCALPISLQRDGERGTARARIELAGAREEHAVLRHRIDDERKAERSEERRVGKECRSRWSP